MKAFISYSHRDAVALDRLHTHLAPLCSEGLINAWFDREILAGGSIDAEISKELESCDIFLMLVSPDFLASDYCVNREMKRALERHRDGAVHVVAIIIEPCDWFSLSIHELKVLPRDGKPISEWMNQNSAYLDVVQELRRIIETRRDTVSGTEHTPFSGGTMDTQAAAPSYRIQKDFDEIHRSEFRETAFATIRNYFQQQIDMINTIDDLRGRFVSHGPNSFGCTIVNRARMRDHGTAHITVHCGNSGISLGDIYYAFSEDADSHSANGFFHIESDNYKMYLRGMMGFSNDQGQLTPENAAKRLWTEFIQPAGISLG